MDRSGVCYYYCYCRIHTWTGQEFVIITVIVELKHGTSQEFVIITVIVELTHGQVRSLL